MTDPTDEFVHLTREQKREALERAKRIEERLQAEQEARRMKRDQKRWSREDR